MSSLADSSKLEIIINPSKTMNKLRNAGKRMAWWMPAPLVRSAPEGREVLVDSAQGDAK